MKRVVCVLLCLCLLAALPVFAEENVRVELNGAEIVFPDVQPTLINDRTMVPMRAIFEALGAGVYWSEEDNSIISMRGSTLVMMQIDNLNMFVNGSTVALDVAPQLVGERTMVPLRAVSESFGLDVQWDEAAQTVRIMEQ